MKKLTFGILLGAVFATPAAAQNFPGLRAEVYGGWDDVSANLSYEDTAFPDDNFDVEGSTDDLMFGGAIGYDMRVADGIYVGLEGTVDLSDNKRCETVFGDDAACFDLKRNLGVGVRLGTRLSSRAMFYAGVAYVNGKATVSYVDEIDPSYNFTLSDTRDGYRLSLGAEARVSGNFYVKAEVRHSNYDDYEVEAGTEKASLGFKRNQVIGGVGVRF